MSSASRRAAIVAVAVLAGTGVIAAQAQTSGAARGAPAGGAPVDFVLPLRHLGAAQVRAQSAAGATIPVWSDTITASQNGKTYHYQMVGQDPRSVLTNPITTITANVIPIVVKLADGTTFDPTVKSCGEKVSALNAVLASPIFNNTPFSPGGTDVGNTQFADAFQRANFWTYTNPSGVNPGYHVLLEAKAGKAITVKVPKAAGRKIAGKACRYGAVTMAYAVQQGLKLLPTLRAKAWGVTPNTFPIFLLHNVQLDKTLGVPGALGFHAAVPNPAFHGAAQTVAVSTYLDPAVSSREPDISVLSHEVGEWLDDPFGNNPTPAWGNTGQVKGHCQANLEVGDPLTGTTFPVVRKGVTYHPQELAFSSWFYGPSPSIAVNGTYSFNGTFTRPALICPPGGL